MRKLSLLLLIPLLYSCERSSPPEFHGRLYFASGNYIGEFDLAQGTSVAVANRGAVTIRNVAAFSGDLLLLAEMATVEGRPAPRITWLNLENGQAETLYAGVIARYLPVPAALIWDDGLNLHVTARRRNSNVNAEITSHGQNQLSTIVDVSEHMVLFEVGIAEQRLIQSYDVVKRELLARDALSEICRLAGAVWIGDRQQLACPARDQSGTGTQYLLVNLNGELRGHLTLPDDKQFVALAYAGDQHALILTERWTSVVGGAERFGVWAYDLIDGKSHRLVSNQYLGDSAVYVPD